MTRIISVVFIVFLLCIIIEPSTHIPLEFLTRPETLVVSEDLIYISDFPVVYLLSPTDFSIINKFGREGEGPEEFKLFIRFHLDEKRIVISSSGKMSYYTKKGKFIREELVPGNNVMKPVGKNHAGYRILNDPDSRLSFVAIDLFDHQFMKIREIHRTPFKFQLEKRQIFPVRNQGNFRVWKDKLFVNGYKGRILVFNSLGSLVRTISPKIKSVRITEEDKKRYGDYYKSYPQYREYYEAASKWFRFPPCFPLIHEIFVSENRIYAETHERMKGKRKFLVMDFKGTQLGSVWLKVAVINPLEKHIYTFFENKFYQLVENDEEERWELSIEPLSY